MEFGISRKIGYKIFDRYKECGVHSLLGGLTSSRFICDLSSAKEVDDAFIFGCFL